MSSPNFYNEFYSPGGSGEKIYQEILEKLRSRLSMSGPIRTSDAWELLRGSYSYGTIQACFKIIMLNLIDQGRAKTDAVKGTGAYRITAGEKPSTRPHKIDAKSKVGPWYSKVYGQWIFPGEEHPGRRDVVQGNMPGGGTFGRTYDPNTGEGTLSVEFDFMAIPLEEAGPVDQVRFDNLTVKPGASPGKLED